MKGLGVLSMLLTIGIVTIPIASIAGIIEHADGADYPPVNISSQILRENNTVILTNHDPWPVNLTGYTVFIGGSGGYDSRGAYIDFHLGQNITAYGNTIARLDDLGFEGIHIPESVGVIIYDPDGHRLT